MERIGDSDDYRFSTGREISVNHGLIGLSKDADGLWEIGTGYDSLLLIPERYDSEWAGGDAEGMTTAEKLELADFMLLQWANFRADLVRGLV